MRRAPLAAFAAALVLVLPGAGEAGTFTVVEGEAALPSAEVPERARRRRLPGRHLDAARKPTGALLR